MNKDSTVGLLPCRYVCLISRGARLSSINQRAVVHLALQYIMIHSKFIELRDQTKNNTVGMSC